MSGDPRPLFPDDSPLGRASTSPVDALALLVEACERGEQNLRPYLDAGHAAIERGCLDCVRYAELAGRFQAAFIAVSDAPGRA